MTQITFKRQPNSYLWKTSGDWQSGTRILSYKTDLSDVSLKDFAACYVERFRASIRRCASSVRKFNNEAQQLRNTVVLCASVRPALCP